MGSVKKGRKGENEMSCKDELLELSEKLKSINQVMYSDELDDWIGTLQRIAKEYDQLQAIIENQSREISSWVQKENIRLKYSKIKKGE